MSPSFQEEKNLRKKGYEIVVGLDEAGRGCLAGPVVAAAVSVRKLPLKPSISGLRDSKKLTPQKREEIYAAIISHPHIDWKVARVSEGVIDRMNIFEATKLAMRRLALGFSGRKDPFLIVDGNFSINSGFPEKSLVRGDEKVFSCAAASVLAKVYRDRQMRNYHKKYPGYGFFNNKGYGTKAHFASIKKRGPCKLHRMSFYPLRKDRSGGKAGNLW